MKKNILLTSLISCGVLLASINITNNNFTSLKAAVGNNSAPLESYYSSLDFTKEGKDLLGDVHDLITSTHKNYPTYNDHGAGLYQQQTDQYYEGDTKVSGYLYDFYTGEKWPNAWDPNEGSTKGGYNREHVWPKSLSCNLWTTLENSDAGGGADMHHIRPLEVRLNSTRNNNKYGVISSHAGKEAYAQYGSNSTYALGGWVDASNFTFEPIDTKKGDVARIILYVYTHYNTYSSYIFGGSATTNGSGDASYFGRLPLTSVITTSGKDEVSALKLMVEWNKLDPVDTIETRRNEQVAIYQGNRNPFIDHPELVDKIWGGDLSDYVTEDEDEDVIYETGTLVCDETSTSAANLKTGKYVIAPSFDSTYYVFDPAVATKNSRYTAISDTSLNKYGNYYVTVTVNGSKATIFMNGTGSNAHTSYYLISPNSGTDLNVTTSSTSATQFTFSASGDAIKFVNGSRGLLFRVSSLTFGNYATSNLTSNSTDYKAIHLFKVDTAYNFLINKLTSMTCSDMKLKSFNDRISFLFRRLSLEELNTLSNLNITVSSGETMNALEAYYYALNQYSDVSSISTILFNENNNILLNISLISLSFIFIANIVIFTKKKRK